jgi:hypothetical protein
MDRLFMLGIIIVVVLQELRLGDGEIDGREESAQVFTMSIKSQEIERRQHQTHETWCQHQLQDHESKSSVRWLHVVLYGVCVVSESFE